MLSKVFTLACDQLFQLPECERDAKEGRMDSLLVALVANDDRWNALILQTVS